MTLSEADTCRIHITPALVKAGWDSHSQIAEQRTFTDGRVIPVRGGGRRRPRKRADYILRYRRNLPLAVVEAKPYDDPVEKGVQQAIDYAEILGLKFAYAANGKHIVERDFLTGDEKRLDQFPSPDDLWRRWKEGEGVDDEIEEAVLTPYYHDRHRPPRYYQTIAINRAVEAILRGENRVLLTLATGTGKSYIAAQVCHRLWQARWNRKGKVQRPRILYLADRVVLLAQPMLGVFAPFGDAVHQIKGKAVKSREIYFSTYQQIAKDESRPGLYREYEPDFFDLIVVDECHRGSARAESNWREILEYFTGAAQLGMTATPKRDDNIDTYAYFGNPIYQYSLREGIADGFLAPYKVRRVVSDVDATGFRPEKGQQDRYGEEIPDELYETPDFERVLVLRDRTEAMAGYITRYLKSTDRFDKTIIFCVDQEHAASMREALIRHNKDLVIDHTDYVCRVTADEGEIGRGHLGRFQDIEETSPVILTTSDMLTTGVDAPTAKNIILCRVVNSMVLFKQIIGRGTRLRPDYGKWYFTILDFTGSATRKFADPDFDGFPAEIIEEPVDGEEGPVIIDVFPGDGEETEEPGGEGGGGVDEPGGEGGEGGEAPRKLYVDDVEVRIVADLVYELDADGTTLRTVKLTDFAGEKVRSLYRSAAELRAKWVEPKYRAAVIDELEDKGIDLTYLAEQSKHPEADPFDLLCHVAFNAPLRSRSERAEAVRRKDPDFWERHSPAAQEVLSAILAKYAEIGPDGLDLPDVLEIPPLAEMGTVMDLANRFGGASNMSAAIGELQQRLYAA